MVDTIKGNAYKTLGFQFSATKEQILTSYNELSLIHHPDKGGDTEEYKKIVEAYELLKNPHQKLKYDLSLLRNEKSRKREYIESEKWNTFFYPINKKVEKELAKQIRSLLLKELEDNGLTQEDLSKYGWFYEDSSFDQVSEVVGWNRKKMKDIEVFCGNDVKDNIFENAIDLVRKYLDVIENAARDKKLIVGTIESLLSSKHDFLAGDPPLTKEELINSEILVGHDDYDYYYERLEKIIFEKTIAKERVKGIKEIFEILEKSANEFANVLKTKVERARKIKIEMLKNLNRWLENGERLLVAEFDDSDDSETKIKLTKEEKKTKVKQERITSFINNFRVFLNPEKRSRFYQEITIIRKIRESEKTQIDDLILRLENWKDKPHEEKDFGDLSPISDLEKQEFIDYLHDLLIKLEAPKTPKTTNSRLKEFKAKPIKKKLGLELDWQAELKNAENKKEAENIRIKAIREIGEKISVGSGSDEELNKKMEEMSEDFSKKIILELLESEVAELSDEESEQLAIIKEDFLSDNFAEEVVKWKYRIINNNIIKGKSKTAEETDNGDNESTDNESTIERERERAKIYQLKKPIWIVE